VNIAVLTLTRDRLAYTQHCFQTLRVNAGCEYDHFVLDQASTDGTGEWLLERDDLTVMLMSENVGISRGLNVLLDEVLNPADYDAVVKFDNDCEVLTPNTLRDVAELAVRWDALLSPRILGLRNPPATIGRVEDETAAVDVTPLIGGIFLAAPAHIFAEGYRHDESNPVFEGDDVGLCSWWRRPPRAGIVGYVDGYEANHYLTTDGQAADIPEYFERRVLEGGPAR
jgi:GT2 family glycosyltransferase